MTSRGSRYWSSGAVPLIAPDLLGNIIATASDVSLVISDMGQILSVLVNPAHQSFGHLDGWEGRDIREVLTVESIPKFEARLTDFVRGAGDSRGVELNHRGAGALDFPIRYSFHTLGTDGALLMLGRDLRPVAEIQRQLVETQMALERDYEAQREIATRMRALMETTTEAIVFVTVASGRIKELNGPAAKLLGANVEALEGTVFAQAFAPDASGTLLEELVAAARAERLRKVKAETRRGRREVGLAATLFRAAGERMLICRLDRGDAVDGSGTDMAGRLAKLYEKGADAIAFTDRTGQILSVNDAFLDLVDLDEAGPARGRSLADFLARGSADLRLMTDTALRNGQMRLYATRMQAEFGAGEAVEISVASLDEESTGALAFVFRDASRMEAVRMPGAAVSDDGMRSARELVGAVTLKEIVSETNDVVEKMCIETAVELTGNNRVAAAEMLGLSRQSLYVKLRKYGLLARGD
ncbi:transcriptional regulator PpsR [Palleronia aestuarii]|uniref:Transcriptional regulator PpsR n=1 Tax=Palleronia aestuarii TaxID=568105 RepID=A0A2W7NT89_9RHOB|nr:transcriptional regulator PpsR [Palleronia aestuarii]PZX16536.1 transcriptional regulator PpsR [Palleronia aestuarii]